MSSEFDSISPDDINVPSSAVDIYHGIPTSEVGSFSALHENAAKVFDKAENKFHPFDAQQYDDGHSSAEKQISIREAPEDVISHSMKDVEHSEPVQTATVLVDSTTPTDMGSSISTGPVDDADDESFLLHSVYFLAAGMFCNFAMYAPVQNVITTVFPGSATVSLILIYLFFTLGTIVAPTLVRYLSAQNGLIIGCLGYLSYTYGETRN